MAVKLFVGGLSYSTSTERLREAFAAVGTRADRADSGSSRWPRTRKPIRR